jgi:hypothetical protein
MYFPKITNVRKRAYCITDFGLRKILVTEDLPEWSDCVSRMPSGLVIKLALMIGHC